MNTNEFFFCYDKEVAKFLRYEKNIRFITTALHKETKAEFWLFHRDVELDKALQEINK